MEVAIEVAVLDVCRRFGYVLIIPLVRFARRAAAFSRLHYHLYLLALTLLTLSQLHIPLNHHD